MRPWTELAKAKEEVPQDGADTTEFTSFDQDTLETYSEHNINLSKMSVNQLGLYAEDGLPKNGGPYTTGSEYPQSPNDGDYHRIEYIGMADDVPARLYRFSSKKQRWIFVEKDLRKVYDGNKPAVSKYTTSKQAISTKNIGKSKK